MHTKLDLSPGKGVCQLPENINKNATPPPPPEIAHSEGIWFWPALAPGLARWVAHTPYARGTRVIAVLGVRWVVCIYGMHQMGATVQAQSVRAVHTCPRGQRALDQLRPPSLRCRYRRLSMARVGPYHFGGFRGTQTVPREGVGNHNPCDGECTDVCKERPRSCLASSAESGKRQAPSSTPATPENTAKLDFPGLGGCRGRNVRQPNVIAHPMRSAVSPISGLMRPSGP